MGFALSAWCRQFVKKYPGIVFFTGVMTWAAGIGIGFNLKLLVERDMIPNHLWRFLPIIGLFQVSTMLTASFLIGMSASVAARRLADGYRQKPTSIDQPPKSEQNPG